mmetsp:Transcript_2477/g.9074  ORF Transcript_2477/g.9074 Transcript_2477/m.9074 type:complete len:177 (-) Transcript_2477:1862-2392(-)
MDVNRKYAALCAVIALVQRQRCFLRLLLLRRRKRRRDDFIFRCLPVHADPVRAPRMYVKRRARMSRLVHVNLSGNAFTGELPPSFAAPKFLRKLEVQDNGFYGEIPEWLIIRRDHLELVDFTRNSFTGALPSAFYSASTKSFPTLPGYGNRPAGCHRGLNSDGIHSVVFVRIGRES